MNNDKIIISKNTVMAFLLLSAMFISCTWALLGDSAASSSPIGSTARAGYYIVTSTSSQKQAPDLLWVANIENQTLSVYGTSVDGVITPLTKTSLNSVFESSRKPVKKRAPKDVDSKSSR